MIDEKTGANSCTRVDVNTCQTVGIFRHDPGNYRNIKQIQFMGQTEGESCQKTGVAENHLIRT